MTRAQLHEASRILCRHRMTAVHMNVLLECDGRTRRMVDLAESCAYSSQAMTRVVDGMVENRLVNRDMDAEDRRCVFITATEEGRQVVADILEGKAP